MQLSPHAKSSPVLDQKITEIIRLDQAFQAIPISIRDTVKELLKRVNSYYSNKIEGNSTKPRELIDINNGEGKKGIEEIRRHITVQDALKQCDYGFGEISSSHFICFLHESFYRNAPSEELEKVSPTGEIFYIQAGKYRTTEVEVGKHFPPDADRIESYMSFFSTQYKLIDSMGLEKYYRAAASHHRLAWIHPFLDGNGRVTRLFTDCYMKAIGLTSYGLWSMSRGFARDISKYYQYLSIADQVRQGNYDGRGILSDRGLEAFTEYFFDTAIDQMQFFLGMLDPDSLKLRVGFYFDTCIAGAMTDFKGKPLPALPKESKDIYLDLLYNGTKFRKDLEVSHGLGEKKLRDILFRMEEYKLVALQHKQPVKALLAPTSVQILFPNLFM